MSLKRIFGVSLCLLTILLTMAACDSASPVAPAGTTLSITVGQSRISINGSTTVRVTALRSNGTPVNPGTQIRLSTTLGTIDGIITTDADGVALGTLRGDGRIGMATVSASVGTTEAATVDVEIGEAAANVSLQANPSSIAETGDRIELLALVRNADGQPLRNGDSLVNFTADLGSLSSGGIFLDTDSDGVARDTLRVSESDISTLSGDSFSVGAQAGGAGAPASVTISIQRPPDAEFSFVVSGLTVAFTDESTNNPTRWRWDFGNGQSSTLQNPTFVFSSAGEKLVTLEVENAIGIDQISKAVQITN
ncbi:MAG: PKD domain-containing protein [Acidobacteriota bacterium]